MAETYAYPTGTPTLTWTPSIDAQLGGASESYDEGVLSEQSAGKQEYRYAEAVKVRTIKRAYRFMSGTDKTNFETFKATAGAKLFTFTDVFSTAHTVSFTSYVTEYTPEAGLTWAWSLEMREEIP
jgi:hypothetical protein